MLEWKMMEGKLSLQGLVLLLCLLIFSVPTVFAQGSCTEDLDCDDGIYCNGAETCDPSLACQPGTDPCDPLACNEDDDVLWELEGTCIVDPPITYQFDFNGDQAWDTGWCLERGETVDVAIWIDDYNLEEALFGSVWLFVNYDANYLKLNTENSYIYTTENGGPWVPFLSHFDDLGGGILFELQAASPWGVEATDGKVKLAVIQLERIGVAPPPGDAQIGSEEGIVVDMSARMFIVADAAVTIYYCDDSNVCTADSCDTVTGNCVQDPAPHNGNSCNDGDFCTVNDTCDNGTCGGTSKDCSPLDDQCNVGICDTVTGNCVQDPAPHNGNSCDDGKGITLNDTCSDGVCTGDIGATSIPTLSEWGMIIFMTIIMGLGVVLLSRRRMV
jgi:hypothetical protein